MKFHFGRTWWMTVLTILVEGLLGILAIHAEVPPEQIAVPAIAIAAATASHNLGRAWEDGKRNENLVDEKAHVDAVERSATE